MEMGYVRNTGHPVLNKHFTNSLLFQHWLHTLHFESCTSTEITCCRLLKNSYHYFDVSVALGAVITSFPQVKAQQWVRNWI